MKAVLDSPFRLGLLTGLIFGTVNLAVTWFYPLLDDRPAALLGFYGPMFFVWALAAFHAARRDRRFWSGVTAGAIAAFATFLVFDLLVLLRVNLFLNQLVDRADWQNMVGRYRASGFESLRLFVNLEYLRGSPLKIGVASMIGAMIGAIGGSLGLTFRRVTAAS